MARRRKGQLSKQLAIVGGVLIAFQLAYIFLVPRRKPPTVQQAIANEITKRNLDAVRAEQLRIQLSVLDYQQEKGELPEKLDLLVPKYFDEIPRVPGTSEPFKYLVKDGRYYVGEDAALGAGGKAGAKGATEAAFPSVDGKEPLPAGVQRALIDSLSPDPATQQVGFIYDPTAKRDPFRPFDFAPKQPDDPTKTPLERYDVNQLKLTAVLAGLGDESSATVENAAGKGFIVKKGTKIGLNSGEVVDIQKDRIVVVETTVDFTGQKKTKTLELRLRTRDQDDALKTGR